MLVSSTTKVGSENARLQTCRRVLDNIRSALTILVTAISLVVLALSAQALQVYDSTNIGTDLGLPLWPSAFDIRPTLAMVACSTIIMITGAASFMLEKFVG
jgi:uncharacterized membrane protein YkvI